MRRSALAQVALAGALALSFGRGCGGVTCEDACTRLAECVRHAEAETKSVDASPDAAADASANEAGVALDAGEGTEPVAGLYFERCMLDCERDKAEKGDNSRKLDCILNKSCDEVLAGQCNDVAAEGCSAAPAPAAGSSAWWLAIGLVLVRLARRSKRTRDCLRTKPRQHASVWRRVADASEL